MAQFTGKGGTVTLNGMAIDFIADWSMEAVSEAERKPFAAKLPFFQEFTVELSSGFDPADVWWLWLRHCTVTIERHGRDFEFEGMCNEAQTRIYLESRVFPGKYFLKHLDDGGKTLRHARVAYDIDEARRWVLHGD